MEQVILKKERAESVDDTGSHIKVIGATVIDQSIAPKEINVESTLQDVASIAKIATAKNPKVLEESKTEKVDGLSNEELLKYEYIPNSVYKGLPKLLQDSCNIFMDRREKDVFLTGTLSVLGGCFHNAYAYNTVDKKGLSPNLLAFIVAPPASGKGALNYSKKIAAKIDSVHRAKKIAEKSASPMFIIPANISSAGLIQVLNENDGVGVMIESEIDTLVNATKQDWGNYSDILRKSFENETVSLYRKTGKELACVENCKLSLAISGTPNQFKSLMKSVENGLFSRGCYYVFSDVSEELKCFGRLKSEQDIDKRFANFANIANLIYCDLQKLNTVNILFSQNQLAHIQSHIQAEYKEVFKSDAIHANIKRAFPNVLKIATILMCIQAYETKALKKETACSDHLIEIALELMKVYLRHGYTAYELLPKAVNHSLGINQQRLLDSLAATFTRGEAINSGLKLDISKKTIDNSIKVFKEKRIIESLKYGKFKKLENTDS